MIIDWNTQNIKQEISKVTFAATDPRMDGFTTWRCKKDLYEILWYVEDCLERCSTYHDEKEFIKSREQQKLIRTLGKK